MFILNEAIQERRYSKIVVFFSNNTQTRNTFNRSIFHSFGIYILRYIVTKCTNISRCECFLLCSKYLINSGMWSKNKL